MEQEKKAKDNMEQQDKLSQAYEKLQKELDGIYQKEEQLKAEQQEIIRRNNLTRWGLYEKIYQKEKSPNAFFDVIEQKYFKKQFFDISNEDYQKLLELDEKINVALKGLKKHRVKKQTSKKERVGNSVASVFKAMAVFVGIAAFILGLILFATGGEGGLIVWVSGFVTCMFFTAISEILDLLAKIDNKLGGKNSKNKVNKNVT